MSNELCYLSAVDAIARFNSRELSPVELLQALIDRAEQVEPTINAFAFTYFDEAMQQAKAAEQAYANGTARELEGVPVAIKDATSIKGKITTLGSLLLKDTVADHTDPLAERVLAAGGIVHATTKVPEFLMASATVSRQWGITYNPWNTDYTPGGSSGGSGAALAAGTTTLASGTDMAGSIRIPSAQNGVVGFKPPYGRVPQYPPINLNAYSHDGPLARTVADALLFENLIAGPHPVDIASISPKVEIPTRFDDIEGMRIGYSVDFGHRVVDHDIAANMHNALDVFRALGADVEEVDLGWTDKCREAAITHIMFITANTGRHLLSKIWDPELLTPYAKLFFDKAAKVSKDEFYAAKLHETVMYQQLSAMFANHDLLICPTMAIASYRPDFDYALHGLEINGESVDPLLGECMTYFFNTLSRCPVLAVPSGHDRNNVPTGIQLVGRTFDDATVFRAGTAYEAARGGFISADNGPKL